MRLRRSLQRLSVWAMLGVLLSFAPIARAAVTDSIFAGGGLAEGMRLVLGIRGPIQGDFRSIVITIVTSVLGLLGLLAVLSIIIAGIYLIVGMGSEQSRSTAKKMILYTIIGLLVVIFARVMVEAVIGIV